MSSTVGRFPFVTTQTRTAGRFRQLAGVRADGGYGSLIDPGNDLIDPPPWRTRTTPRKLTIAVTVTVGVLCAVGSGLMVLVIRLLGLTGAPPSVVWAPWYVPTVAAVGWALRHRTPATVDDDGDESWTIYALRAALVGAGSPRPRRVRVAAAVVLGAPIAWSLVIIGVLALAGIV